MILPRLHNLIQKKTGEGDSNKPSFQYSSAFSAPVFYISSLLITFSCG